MIVNQELHPDFIRQTLSNGEVRDVPYLIDENGEEYVECDPKKLEKIYEFWI